MEEQTRDLKKMRDAASQENHFAKKIGYGLISGPTVCLN